uniref:Uncharacterized protein n=1 Tax=Oryza meridionalis TaxID=40149 RepID=A0A0E0C4A7_9ORYZ
MGGEVEADTWDPCGSHAESAATSVKTGVKTAEGSSLHCRTSERATRERVGRNLDVNGPLDGPSTSPPTGRHQLRRRIQSQHPRICEFGLSTAVSRAGDWWRRRRDSPGQRVPQPADEVRDSGRRTAHCCFICRAGVLSAGECRVAVGVDPLEVLDRLPDRGAVHQMNRREAGNSTRSTVRAPKLVSGDWSNVSVSQFRGVSSDSEVGVAVWAGPNVSNQSIGTWMVGCCL